MLEIAENTNEGVHDNSPQPAYKRSYSEIMNERERSKNTFKQIMTDTGDVLFIVSVALSIVCFTLVPWIVGTWMVTKWLLKGTGIIP